MADERKIGFAPIFDKNSRVLILGSFPSVKSREIDFYYGNKQNRFWKMLYGFFQEEIPFTKEEKIEFLLRRNVALWDMVISCEIEGSSDASVKNVELADIPRLLKETKIEKILLNGTLAYNLFAGNYATVSISYEKMPSTSPANPRYDEIKWRNQLNDVFRIY
ncbi:MAG: DNA-deoxyinosine glycosylase [Clostridiales bacterium]|nr:DNA-deoxyinosine glycosylase [Clostridiales bacterium]